MKLKLFVSMFAGFVLSNCERKNAIIQNEISIIKKTTKDTNLPDYIRKSSGIFADILMEKKELPDHDLSNAHTDMMELRNETTIATYVAFLKALEKKLPDKLPPPEVYEAMEEKAGKSKIIEYNVGQTVIMMCNTIQNVTLYNNLAADAEVEEVLKQIKEKHGASETGKKILEFLYIVHENGLQDRASGIKPWETPRRPPEYVH